MFKKIHLTVFVIFTVCFSFLNLMGQKTNRISIKTTCISEKPDQEKGILNHNGRAELMPGFLRKKNPHPVIAYLTIPTHSIPQQRFHFLFKKYLYL